MDAGTLNKAISAVCPITGVSVGNSTDRATWSYDPTVAATQAEKDAADNVIATIPVDEMTPSIAPEDQVLFDHENRIRALEGTPPLQMSAFLTQKLKKVHPLTGLPH